MTDEVIEGKFSSPQEEKSFFTPLTENQRRGFQDFLRFYPQITKERKNGHGTAEQNNTPLTEAELLIKENVGKIFSHFSTQTFFADLEELGQDHPSF